MFSSKSNNKICSPNEGYLRSFENIFSVLKTQKQSICFSSEKFSTCRLSFLFNRETVTFCVDLRIKRKQKISSIHFQCRLNNHGWGCAKTFGGYVNWIWTSEKDRFVHRKRNQVKYKQTALRERENVVCCLEKSFEQDEDTNIKLFDERKKKNVISIILK